MSHTPPVVSRALTESATDRIASNIRAGLARRKISGRQLAGLVGWTAATTNRRLAGDAELTIGHLELISAATGIPMSVLLDGVDSTEVAR